VYTNWFANRVRGTARRRFRRSSSSSTGGAGTATGIRLVPPGRRAGWTPGVPRRAGTAWPGRRTGRSRKRTWAAGRWPGPAAKTTRRRLSLSGRRPRQLRPRQLLPRQLLLLPRRRRRRRRRRPVPAESTAPVARTTTSPWNGACGNTQRTIHKYDWRHGVARTRALAGKSGFPTSTDEEVRANETHFQLIHSFAKTYTNCSWSVCSLDVRNYWSVCKTNRI